MIDLLQRASVRSTLLPPYQENLLQQTEDWRRNSAPLQHPTERDRGRRDSEQGVGGGSNNGTHQVVARWLASTEGGSPRGYHTPPLEMNGGRNNSMPAPMYGGLYNNTTAGRLNPISQQSMQDGYGNSTSLAVPDVSRGHISQPQSPTQPKGVDASYGTVTRRRSSSGGNQIVSYLQIPSSINNSKGSLAEFAAQITCLFWFESSFTLHRVEEAKITPTPTTPLVLEAVPTMGFRKWVTTILSTTQVSQNVILLALMFIYRLKKLNPTVKGKPGSEFRLLTVALMLGNKFLDDNTYTNKTWAEVSGISVQEIHIMEVEFLSNMRYTLYASELEWNLWHHKLGRFWDYFDKASRTSAQLLATTANLNGPHPLPSPPTSSQASPPFSTNQISNGLSHSHPLAIPSYLAPTISSPIGRMPEIDLRPSGRKRSWDDESQEPASKRIVRGPQSSVMPPMTTSAPNPSYSAPRLPIPNLSISTSGHIGMLPGSYSAHLPPPTGRAMSTVYPSGNQWPQSGSLTGQLSQQSGSASTLPPTNEQFRRPYNAGSRTVSPTSTNFPQSSQDLLSPSGYPAQRSSPYRPLRTVNTLLVPPPSASLHNPSRNVGYNNMHYQPLGKPLSERKTGVVPYTQNDTWQQLPQMQQWPSLPQLPQTSQPSLPQPNFRF